MHHHHKTAQTGGQTVLYLGPDTDLPGQLAQLLGDQGIELVCAAAPVAAPALEHEPRYLALILDTALLGPTQTLKAWLETLARDGITGRHLLVIARSKEIGLRLQALRANATACFVAPVAALDLVATLLLACRPQPKTAHRVLVVDDDATQTLLLERFLTAAGFQVRALTDPLKVLEVLAVFEPDLILLDLNMPGADGAELATIIREQNPLQVVPILFLSVERDPERQLEALNRGGDAFLTKPIDPALLVKAVSRRISAHQALRRRLARADQCDPATGLATRSHFLMVLERTSAQAAATPPGSGLLIMVIDGTARLIERLGPGGLDLVRNRLGQRLQGLLTPDDLAVCLDDHYHAVLIRRARPEALRQAAEGLREAVAAAPLAVAGTSVALTLSIGLGLVRTAPGDALTLISRAEQACAQAQRAGGNRLAIYQSEVPGPEDVFHTQRIDNLIAWALTDANPGQGFRLFYQPLVPVATQGRHCLEVLLRLAEEDGTLIPALDFLPIAERSGRTIAIDLWVMGRTLRVLARHSQAQPHLSLLVRQHLESLAAPGRLLELQGQLAALGLTPGAVVLALDAGALLEQRRVSGLLVKMLRKLGIEVCLLEVDQTPAVLDLVAELRPPLVRLTLPAVQEASPERLTSLVQRLRQAGAEVIAAGIDTPAQIGPVWSSGVSYAQGALIQPPLTGPVFDWDDVVVG